MASKARFATADYIREASGAEFTAKDFHTWHGKVHALEL